MQVAGEAEPRQFGPAVLVHEDVGWPQVAMQDGAGVQKHHPPSQIPAEIVDGGLRKRQVDLEQGPEVTPHAVLCDGPQVVACLVPGCSLPTPQN
jgi:hypothetical protein